MGARALLAGALAALAAASPAQAADRWRIERASTIPPSYNQGVAAVPGGLVFSGTFQLFRTGTDLRETARAEPAIPADVGQAEGYNHIGDIAYERAEGGRLILPLECYTLSAPRPNTCGTGSFGVADPATLQWRYHVKLDPAFIRKAMWVEPSPDGALLWTQNRTDLLAYRTAEVAAANRTTITPEGPRGVALRPARRLRRAMRFGATGAAFVGRRLYLAEDDNPFCRIWSVDLRTGERRLELTRRIVGESEGLAAVRLRGGTLQWTILPVGLSVVPPTYGANRGALLSLARVTSRARTGGG